MKAYHDVPIFFYRKEKSKKEKRKVLMDFHLDKKLPSRNDQKLIDVKIQPQINISKNIAKLRTKIRRFKSYHRKQKCKNVEIEVEPNNYI